MQIYILAPSSPLSPISKKNDKKAKATKWIIGRGERGRGVQIELRFRAGPGAQEGGRLLKGTEAETPHCIEAVGHAGLHTPCQKSAEDASPELCRAGVEGGGRTLLPRPPAPHPRVPGLTLLCFSLEPLVCQPRGQQQHAQPHPQLRAEDPLAARAHLSPEHAHVPAAR